MKVTEKELTAQWINDYLDLYNFAVTIGDTDWQQQLLQTLADKDKYIQAEQEQVIVLHLWLKFDSINRKMIELYEQLRNTRDSEYEQRRLIEKVWEFKQQRIMIVSKLKELYVTHGE